MTRTQVNLIPNTPQLQPNLNDLQVFAHATPANSEKIISNATRTKTGNSIPRRINRRNSRHLVEQVTKGFINDNDWYIPQKTFKDSAYFYESASSCRTETNINSSKLTWISFAWNRNDQKKHFEAPREYDSISSSPRQHNGIYFRLLWTRYSSSREDKI